MASASTSTRPKRRWRTLSLRALMVLIVAVAGGLAWHTNRARGQQRAAETIVSYGGTVLYDDLVDDKGDCYWAPVRRPLWQQWVSRHVGEDYVRKVRQVSLINPGQDPEGPPPPREPVTALAWLPDLINLTLVEWDLADADLAPLAHLRRLRYLDLWRSPRITSAGLAHLRDKRALWYLALQDAAIDDAGLAHLADLTALVHLNLAGTRIRGAGLAHLRGLRALSMLKLDDTALEDEGLAHLVDLPRLSYLHLDRTNVSDAGMLHLGRMTNLEILGFDRTRVSDAGIARLTNLKQLRALSLSDTQVTDQSLPVLRGLTALERVDLAGTRVTPAGVAALRRERPALIVHVMFAPAPTPASTRPAANPVGEAIP